MTDDDDFWRSFADLEDDDIEVIGRGEPRPSTSSGRSTFVSPSSEVSRTKKRKLVIENGKRMGYKTTIDAAVQTVDDPTPVQERTHELTNASCPVCLQEYADSSVKNSNNTALFVSHCGHAFCGNCRVSMTDRMGLLSCPICRRKLRGGEIIKCHFSSIETLAVSERVKLVELLKEMKELYVGRCQTHLSSLTTLHQKAIDFLKAPAYLGKKCLSHKLTQMQSSMNFSLLNEKVQEVRRGLHEMTFTINNVVSQIEHPESFIEFSLSDFLVRSVIKSAIAKQPSTVTSTVANLPSPDDSTADV